MKQTQLISVIIPFYNRLDLLSLALYGFTRQSDSAFEIIIAEDNDIPQHRRAVADYQSSYPQLRIRHISQPDTGFRKNRILNKVTQLAAGDILVFIDGDCIPHRHFVHQHRTLARQGTALAGRRVNLGPETTKRLICHERIAALSWPRLVFSDSKRIEEALYFFWLPPYFNRPRGLLGCNWSIYKSDLLSINGHDEDYQRASVGEDSDVEWRLLKSGIQIRSIKFRAIVYHLHHASNYNRQDIEYNLALMRKKQQAESTFCKNGLKAR